MFDKKGREFNDLIISKLIFRNYLGEIRSHQESGHLTMSPKISPRVQTSHQESNRLTKCDAMLVRFNLTKSLTNMGVPQREDISVTSLTFKCSGILFLFWYMSHVRILDKIFTIIPLQ